MRLAVLFPGQGTQRPGAGDDWRHHPSWRVVEEAEAATGQRLAPLLLEATAEDLARTREAQLSVLLASLVAWDAVKDSLPEPVAFAGHSLGQITALVASGALDLAEGVVLARNRAEATQAAADTRPGRLVALLGATREQADAACEAAPGECWPANDNAPGQIVVGGTPGGVEAAVARAKELGVRKALPLDVGGAFHTPLMQPAADRLAEHLDGVTFARPVSPVVANTDARAHGDADWRPRLVDHLVRPVLWRQSVETLVTLGVDTVVEVGPGTTLTALVRRIAPDLATRNVSAPADVPAPAL